MSIADKITSIEEHLTDDYEGLENLGADLTNVNKNIQNIRTCLDTIYDNLPKTTGEGSNLSLSPTLKGKLNIEAYKGDTSQDSTEGYNILNFNSYVVLEDNMLSTNAGSGRILASDIQLQANTTYYFKFILLKKPIAQTTLTSYIDGTPDTTIGQGNIQGYSVGTLVTKQITPTSNCILSMAIWGNANAETIEFQYWVTTDNSKNTFEPYTNGASPNPTYPQPISVVTGQQEVVVENKNLCDGQFRQGGWHDNVGTTRIMTSQNLVIRKGTTLTISTTLDTTQYKYGVVVGKLPYPQTTNPNIYDSGWLTSSSKTFTFNVKGYDIGYLAINVATSDGNGNISPSDIASATWQIELGSTSTSYVEHQEQTKTLHLGDIELCKIGTYQDRIFETSGKNLTELSSISTTGGGYINYSVSQLAEVEQGKTYTLSLRNNTSYTSNLNVRISSGGTYTTETQGNLVANGIKSYTFTASQSGVLNLNTQLGTTDTTNAFTQIMLNYGSTALPYEPYGSDKWYIENKAGKYVYNSSDTWNTGEFGTNSYSTRINEMLLSDNSSSTNPAYVVCNMFRGISYNGRANSGNNIVYSDANIYTSLYVRNTSYTSLADFKSALSSGNFKVYYVLATPTYTEITNESLIEELNELEKIMSYNGQTNISVTGSLPMILSVSALKGE